MATSETRQPDPKGAWLTIIASTLVTFLFVSLRASSRVGNDLAALLVLLAAISPYLLLTGIALAQRETREPRLIAALCALNCLVGTIVYALFYPAKPAEAAGGGASMAALIFFFFPLLQIGVFMGVGIALRLSSPMEQSAKHLKRLDTE